MSEPRMPSYTTCVETTALPAQNSPATMPARRTVMATSAAVLILVAVRRQLWQRDEVRGQENTELETTWKGTC